MSIRSKFFATVALPVFAASLAVQPALADSLKAPFEVAQEEGGELSPEELLLLKKRKKQRAAEEKSQGQAKQQQGRAEERQRAEERAPRRAERKQQRAAEQEAQQAEEQQRALRKKRQAEKQRASEQEAQQAEEQQRAFRKKRQAEKQRAAEQEAQQAEEQQRALRKKRQAEKQRVSEKEAQQVEEQQRAFRKKRQAEKQRAAEQEAQQAEEQQRALRKKRQAEKQRAAEQEAQQAEEQQRALRKKRQAEKQRASEEERQVAPGAEGPVAAERFRGEQRGAQPVPEVVDERTEEERLKIAEDPASTDETIVLPVERGAAVLDSDKDADNISGNRAREARRKQREELRAREEQVAPPTDDAAAQVAIPAEIKEELPQRIEALLSEEGERFEEAPAFAVPETANIVNNTVINNTTIHQTTETSVTELREVNDRVILGAGDRIFVRGDDRPRLRQHAEETYYDNLSGGRIRETIVRPDGYRIVTVYNRYGDILSRMRVDSDGNEYVMIYAPDHEDRRRPAIFDVGYELPPMRLTIPVDEYVVDYADDPDRDYYEFLAEPPVEPVERVYTIDEVRYSARLRDKVRRIDLDTIHFATGSAEVSISQARTLRNVALAMEKIIAKDPGETFFIEGHTDAIGSDQSNLVLSDRRAEGVAVLLTEVYGIPPESLVTQGYGERFLKIRTQEAEQENRRVTIRRVTPLVRPVAQR